MDNLEHFYNNRLEVLLSYHLKMVKEDKNLTEEQKQRQIEKVEIIRQIMQEKENIKVRKK